MFQLSALSFEYMYEHGLSSSEQVDAASESLRLYLSQRLNDRLPPIDEIEALIERELNDVEPNVEAHLPLDWPQLVRSFASITVECPIDRIEQIGRALQMHELVHRARVAYDDLRAFIRRHDPGCIEVLRIVGEQYRNGHLPLDGAARLLELSPSDAVFELERAGYARSLDAIALTDAERDEAYQKLRARRRRPGVAPVVEQALVDRDVIASERIEGVDVRAWVRPRC